MPNRVQCNRITKKGTQCSLIAIPGSEFCRRHQPREIWVPLIFSLVISFILGSISAIVIDAYFFSKSIQSELSSRHIIRPRNVPAIGGFPVIIDDGITMIVEKPGFVTSKCADGPFDYRIDEDGAIKIYGEIRRSDGTVVAEAIGNHIRVITNEGFDINSDSQACEIVDANGKPVYQLSIVPSDEWRKRREKVLSQLDQDTYDNRSRPHQSNIGAKLEKAYEVVQLRYIHRKDQTWWCVTPEGSQRVDNLKRMQEWQNKISPLFKYPGKKYPGIRINDFSQ